MEEHRRSIFSSRGQMIISATLLIQLLGAAIFAGQLLGGVQELENQVHALTQRIARLEDLMFRR